MLKQQNTPLNILLADDDKDDRFFFEKALMEIPIATHLITVNDGEELMAYLSGSEEALGTDVLFLDLSMPRKNGFECLAEINQNETLKDIPVVMFSTSYPRDKNYEKELINMLTRIGAYHHIRKPGDFEELKKVILNALHMVTEKKSLNS